MPEKEATARIKINRLLEAAGWRFFQEGQAAANIRLEPGVTIKSADLDALGDNFEATSRGFVDFLLLDAKGFPLIVLEAKAEDKNPRVGKEQARKYARSQNCRFVIVSNGNLHYFWDLERGNPYVITTFPTSFLVRLPPDAGEGGPDLLLFILDGALELSNRVLVALDLRDDLLCSELIQGDVPPATTGPSPPPPSPPFAVGRGSFSTSS